MNDAAVDEKIRLSTRSTLVLIALLVFLLLMGLVFYTFAHEGGHAVAGLLFGGRITSFSINFLDLSAHVGLDGEFSLTQRAITSAAGVMTPLIFSLGLLLLTAKNREFVFYSFKSLIYLISVNSLLAWVAIPLLALAGKQVGDDSFNFLNYTRISPLVESGAALALYVFGWVIFFRQVGGVRLWMSRFRNPTLEWTTPAARRTVLSLAAVGAVVLASTFALSQTFPSSGVFSAPAGYQQAAKLDLSQGGYTNESIYRFRLDQPTSARMVVLLFDINRGPINIRLTGPAGFESEYLNLLDPKTDIGRAKVNPPAEVLQAGEYEVLVSLPECKGKVEIYTKMDPAE